jgi:uncharacterized C2H2 Zn-finger protein
VGDILGDQAEPDTNATSILKCNECDSEFPSFHQFKLHVFKQHVKNPDYVECEICFELVYSAFRLFSHRKLVHPGKIADYKKTVFDFFKNANLFLDHYGSAIGPKPTVEQVEVAAKKHTEDQTSLVTNLIIKIEPELAATPKLYCKFCQVSFGTTDMLSKHERTHTEGDTNHCKSCDEIFHTKHQFQMHLKDAHP